jgi:hypothetical protein
MVVHDVEVDDVGASGENIVHLQAQRGEVGGQDAWRNSILGHGTSFNKPKVWILP